MYIFYSLILLVHFRYTVTYCAILLREKNEVTMIRIPEANEMAGGRRPAFKKHTHTYTHTRKRHLQEGICRLW